MTYISIAGTMPNFCMIYSNVSLGRVFVKISTICLCVPIYSSLTFCYVACSLKKWYLIGMCFVFECISRFFEMFIEMVSSHIIDIG
jgi:hypothetical protein